MASDIHGVLLLPHEGDLLGLLREGLCGASPPMAWLDEAPSLARWRAGSTPLHQFGLGRPAPKEGLVLAWDGGVVHTAAPWVPDTRGTVGPQGWVPAWVHDIAMMFAGIYDPAEVAANLDAWGAPVFLDAEGREVTP